MPKEKVYYDNFRKWNFLFDKKKYKEALPIYKRVLAIHPDDKSTQRKVDFIIARLK
jgi:hypothetical protein